MKRTIKTKHLEKGTFFYPHVKLFITLDTTSHTADSNILIPATEVVFLL